MGDIDHLTEKINNVREEMKINGLWKKQLPAWVSEYESDKTFTGRDFTEWLQFVYLPNLVQTASSSSGGKKKNVVPQALKFLGEDVKKGKLLQLLIELDSLL